MDGTAATPSIHLQQQNNRSYDENGDHETHSNSNGTAITTNPNMLDMHFALTLQSVIVYVGVRWLCNAMMQNGRIFVLVCFKL